MVKNLLKDLGVAKYTVRDSCSVSSPAWKSGMKYLHKNGYEALNDQIRATLLKLF
jgi:hypothetical protein